MPAPASPTARRTTGLSLAALLALGCSGAIEGAPSGVPGGAGGAETGAPAGVTGGSTGGASAGSGGTVAACTPGATPSPLRRLTRSEYNATVADLLGDTTRPADAFVADDKIGPFDGNATSPISDLALEQIWEAAATLSTRATTTLTKLLPCDSKVTGEDACARTFVAQFGARAYRRPLEPTEIDGLLARYATGKAQAGFANGVRLALHAMLVSPSFLYHVEIAGGPADARGLSRVSDFELASRLSYFLWGSMPDEALTAVAASGKLHTPDVLEAQARRLLADARARARLRNFHHDWLGLGEISVRRVLPAALVAGAREDVLATVMDALASGRTSSLFTTDVAFIDKALAPSYGLDPATFGTTAKKVTLAEPERRGILARVGALLTHGTPSSRGKFVREEILCQHVPNPPANVNTELPDAKPGEPPRARWERHVTDPSCGGCHRLIDPIGFAFDHFDDMGKHRTMNGGFAVDARGELNNVTGGSGPLTGARELQEKLSATGELRGCLAEQWFTFAYGRNPGTADECTVEAARAAFTTGGDALEALLLALVKAEAFSMRKVVP